MTRTQERLIGLGLGTLAIGVLEWHMPNWALDPWESSGQIPIGLTMIIIVLGLLSIYLLLRPTVSK